MNRSGTLVFVPPRYGPGVVGGAEAVLAETAKGLASRGWNVEILTTCASDHYTWDNDFPEGVTIESGVTVRRFPTVVDRNNKRGHNIGVRIPAGEAISIQDQQYWINSTLRVPRLWHHMLDHSDSYRAVVVAPYMFWTSFACGQVAPEKTIVMPCLHDEPSAQLDVFQPLMSGARGIWFLSEPERDLAAETFQLPTRHEVVGSGVEITDKTQYQPERFKAEHGLTRPFVYFAGRREYGKGWNDLLRAFQAAVEQGIELDLVTSGVGVLQRIPALSGRLIDVGKLSDSDRDNAMAAASAYVQPSANESFSRSVLEAWLAGTLVIANGESAVVQWHVDRSKAGLSYQSDAELIEALRFVAESPDHARRLAVSGREYVESNYRPDRVLDAMEETLVGWTPEPSISG